MWPIISKTYEKWPKCISHCMSHHKLPIQLFWLTRCHWNKARKKKKVESIPNIPTVDKQTSPWWTDAPDTKTGAVTHPTRPATLLCWGAVCQHTHFDLLSSWDQRSWVQSPLSAGQAGHVPSPLADSTQPFTLPLEITLTELPKQPLSKSTNTSTPYRLWGVR